MKNSILQKTYEVIMLTTPILARMDEFSADHAGAICNCMRDKFALLEHTKVPNNWKKVNKLRVEKFEMN